MLMLKQRKHGIEQSRKTAEKKKTRDAHLMKKSGICVMCVYVCLVFYEYNIYILYITYPYI